MTGAANYISQTYTLSDTWAHISNSANAGLVAGAAGHVYAISDIGHETNLTLVQVALLQGAGNYTTQTYTLSDTWANISNAGNAAVVSGAASHVYSISNIGNQTIISFLLNLCHA